MITVTVRVPVFSKGRVSNGKGMPMNTYIFQVEGGESIPHSICSGPFSQPFKRSVDIFACSLGVLSIQMRNNPDKILSTAII